jgi:hypothetical protein
MKKSTKKWSVRLTALVYLLAVALVLVVSDACNKSRHNCDKDHMQNQESLTGNHVATAMKQNAAQAKVVSVLSITPSTDGSGTWVNFKELAEQFTVTDAAVLDVLKVALNENNAIKITFDPWKGLVTKAEPVSAQERMTYSSRSIIKSPGSSVSLDLASVNADVINTQAAMGVINTTAPATGLTNVVPDMATAQLMFDYIAHQCCVLSGPYGVDHCITFQYCEDGCYARAHKMCYVINNRFHYATHKIFSFAYPGAYTLAVKGEKWGGCCIRWWYHVAPLVNIKTPLGVKAFVFDPAMFDQPVLLATWLHAQENPACAGSRIPKVTSYNIQPTTSYAPNDTASFMTDPMYTDTDATLVSYNSLISCP